MEPGFFTRFRTMVGQSVRDKNIQARMDPQGDLIELWIKETTLCPRILP